MSLKEYLFASGILENGTTEEIIAAKKEYRKQYIKRKKQEYKQSRTITTLSFHNDEMKIFVEKAQAYDMRLPQFLKACINAYLEQIFVLPNADEVQHIELLLLKIGNNINQVTRLCNRLSIPPDQAIKEVYQLLQQLDTELTELFRKPKNIENIIVEGLQNQPSFLPRLQTIVDQYTHASQNNPTPRQDHQKTTGIHG